MSISLLEDFRMNFIQFVETTSVTPAQVAARTAQIHTAVLKQSKWLDGANFTKIHPDDLKNLFGQYDSVFFGGQLKHALGSTPLRFSLSSRLTSSGGITTTITNRKTGQRRY